MDAEIIIDTLYGVPLGEFTWARDSAASELRRAGAREEAEQVKSLRKPTGAAAAVNQLVREHRREVEAFLKAAASLRDAQFAGKGDLAAARNREREAFDRLIQVGGVDVRQSRLEIDSDRQWLATDLDALHDEVRSIVPVALAAAVAVALLLHQKRLWSGVKILWTIL